MGPFVEYHLRPNKTQTLITVEMSKNIITYIKSVPVNIFNKIKMASSPDTGPTPRRSRGHNSQRRRSALAVDREYDSQHHDVTVDTSIPAFTRSISAPAATGLISQEESELNRLDTNSQQLGKNVPARGSMPRRGGRGRGRISRGGYLPRNVETVGPPELADLPLGDTRNSDHAVESPTTNRTVHVARVGDVALNTLTATRGGFILCCGNDDSLYFGLGNDARTREYTDFAGQIKRSIDRGAAEAALSGDKTALEGALEVDRDILDTALREAREELLGILGFVGRAQVENCTCIYDNDNFIVFVRLPWLECQGDTGFSYITDKFNIAYAKASAEYIRTGRNRPEVSGIRWFGFTDFLQQVNKPQMYTVVSDFLQRALAEQDSFLQHL